MLRYRGAMSRSGRHSRCTTRATPAAHPHLSGHPTNVGKHSHDVDLADGSLAALDEVRWSVLETGGQISFIPRKL